MTNMSGDVAETSVADFLIAKIWSVSGSTNVWNQTPQKWSGPDPRTRWKLTPMITGIV